MVLLIKTMTLSKLLYELKDNPTTIASMALFILFFFLFVGQLLELGNFLLRPSQQSDYTVPIIHPQRNANNQLALKTPLFGSYIPAAQEIKESLLALEVVGIMYDKNEKNAQVLLRAANGEENVYGINDSLPGGAIIKKINMDSIVVLHNGALERIRLPKSEISNDAPLPSIFPQQKQFRN